MSLSSAVQGMTNRLLLVEPSATMRYVLEKHAQSLGFVVDVTESYGSATESLNRQYQQFGSEYSGLLFGWPSVPQEDAAAFSVTLEQSEFKDLPVVVMSTDMRAETRAWVAGRDNTAVLPWREYQGLEALLQRLIEVAPDDSDTFPTKFDNSDIRLLVVDDSATIRYSLRDLFQMQGYQVSLAATQEEALRLASESRFDIAVLDFYLTETTGDLLCRALMTSSDVGDIVCTVLTGTYSDHIIKRSLRAGAVECMFKNESSELLLSRIDAISRFVRQRRTLVDERELLESIIESVAGAVLIIDADHRISYINSAALEQLELDTATSILGQPSETLLELDGPAEAGDAVYTATWRLPGGESLEVDYEHMLIGSGDRHLIRFVRRKISIEQSIVESPPIIDSPIVAKGAVSITDTLVKHFGLAETSRPFISQMLDYVNEADSQQERVSLLVLDVFVEGAAGLQSVAAHKELETIVRSQLHAVYKRSGHVGTLSGNRFGFLLRHWQEPQAYLLVRKILQLCLEIDHGMADIRLACNGSLLSLTDNANQPVGSLMQHAFKGVELAAARAPNQALLLDLRRMLSAYPAGSKDSA